MITYKDPYTRLDTPTVIALGCFDGVHAAHAHVISEAVRIAREKDIRACVWCFSEPPKNMFLPVAVPLICDMEEKSRLIRRLGTDILVCPDFTPEIGAVEAERFVREILCGCGGARHLVCGKNYSFGAGGKGDVALLRDLCSEMGIGLSVVDDVTVDGVRVSSSLIREAAAAGHCTYASRLLGRDMSVLCESKDNGELFVSSKYLCPPEGVYEIKLTDKAASHSVQAELVSAKGGMRVILPTETEKSVVRLYFVSNRLKRKKQ